MREIILAKIVEIKRLAADARDLHSIELGCVAAALQRAADEIGPQARCGDAGLNGGRRINELAASEMP